MKKSLSLLEDLQERFNNVEEIKPIEVDQTKLTFASRNFYFFSNGSNWSVGVFSYSSMDDENGFFRVLTNEDNQKTFSI